MVRSMHGVVVRTELDLFICSNVYYVCTGSQLIIVHLAESCSERFLLLLLSAVSMCKRVVALPHQVGNWLGLSLPVQNTLAVAPHTLGI